MELYSEEDNKEDDDITQFDDDVIAFPLFRFREQSTKVYEKQREFDRLVRNNGLYIGLYTEIISLSIFICNGWVFCNPNKERDWKVDR